MSDYFKDFEADMKAWNSWIAHPEIKEYMVGSFREANRQDVYIAQ